MNEFNIYRSKASNLVVIISDKEHNGYKLIPGIIIWDNNKDDTENFLCVNEHTQYFYGSGLKRVSSGYAKVLINKMLTYVSNTLHAATIGIENIKVELTKKDLLQCYLMNIRRCQICLHKMSLLAPILDVRRKRINKIRNTHSGVLDKIFLDDICTD